MSSLSTLPKGDSAWLLRKAIERIMQQVSVLETNIGSSTTGNSANTQIIFNDNGTLRGDTGLVFNKTTDTLTVAGLVTAGSATITGDLTVDTSTLKVDSTNNRVGIGTATPNYILDVLGASPRFHIKDNGTGTSLLDIENGAGTLFVGRENSTGSSGLSGVPYAGIMYLQGAYPLIFGTNFVERYRIDATGVATWSVAGSTAMTLNSTGLGIGGNPTEKLSVNGSIGFQNGGTQRWHISATSGSDLVFTRSAVADRFTITSDGNVGVGITPSAWSGTGSGQGVVQLGNAGCSIFGAGVGFSGDQYCYINNNSYYTSTGFKYFRANGAAQYAQVNNSHRWLVSSNAQVADTLITFTQAMTLDASGRLLVGTVTSGTSAGDGIIGFGTRGLTVGNSNASVASGSFIDIAISTTANGYQGFLSVANTQNTNAAVRTQTTFSVFGRGASATFTTIATADGPTSGASFTVTVPSNGVIRITNTLATFDTTISAQFFGGTSA